MNKDEQEIRQLVSTWLAASENGQTDQILKLMADDVIFLTAGQPPMNKEGFIAAQTALQHCQLQISSDIQEIRIMVDDWAYCWNKLTVVVTPPNRPAPIKRSGSSLSILHKQQGQWVIIRDANMLTST